VVNGEDLGGAELLTGLALGDATRFALNPLPFPFFGPTTFPLGPTCPPVLASHAATVFTPEGKRPWSKTGGSRRWQPRPCSLRFPF
jgi:hypothetical protein